MKNLRFIFNEYKNNLYKVIRISWYEFTSKEKDSYLNVFWIVLGPLIQIGVYWFVFGLGIRNGKPINGVPFLPWMLSGIIPWFFINPSIIQGANSINAKQGIITKMKFPISTIPLITVLTQLYNHLVMLMMLIITNVALGFKLTIYSLQLVYFLIASLIFLLALSLVTSTLVMIIRDVQKLIQSTMRLVFYLTPILWIPDRLPPKIQFILVQSPIYYIVNGYRNSLIYHRPFYLDIGQTISFWIITILLLFLGANLQMKFRNKFIDML
jgi:teichoic acid transport system permease protein